MMARMDAILREAFANPGRQRFLPLQLLKKDVDEGISKDEER